MKSNNTAPRERIPFLDYVRVVAIFMVMLVHASENFYSANTSGIAGNMSLVPCEANRFWVAFWDGGVSRTCVPLFMIVSAYLLVPMRRGQTMAQFYRHRLLRILPPMLVFMLLYCLLPLAWGGMTTEQAWKDLVLLPFNFPSMAGHLWFMYPLISLYLIIPVISPWLEKATAREERIFIGLFAVSTFIPWIHRFITPEVWGECFWNPFTALWYCSGFIGYLVMAHYIRFHMHWNRRRRISVGTACFLAGAAFTCWSFWFNGSPGVLVETNHIEWAWHMTAPNVVLATFGAFLLFTCINVKQAPAAITSISKLSFGMYLMHLFFLPHFAAWFIQGDQANPIIPVGLAIPCIAALTYVSTLIVTKLVSLLPGSKWIVGA